MDTPQEVIEKISLLRRNMERAIIGKPEVVRLAAVALLARGHLLVEDVPGVGKTTLAQALARSLDGTLNRIQFTIDLLPSDVLGVSVFNPESRDFEFRHGPIFANVVLADEINRTTPKTQSSLLEAMNEFQVTVDNATHELPRPFIVLATQNPIEYCGTYPLPESQLDRFLMRIRIGYPDRDHERTILQTQGSHPGVRDLGPVLTTDEVAALQDLACAVRLEASLEDYLLDLVEATRRHGAIELGASPRGGLFLYRAAQANALTEGRDYCIPDDIKKLAVAVLSHRIILKSQTGNGLNPRGQAERVIREILASVPVPL